VTDGSGQFVVCLVCAARRHPSSLEVDNVREVVPSLSPYSILLPLLLWPKNVHSRSRSQGKLSLISLVSLVTQLSIQLPTRAS
jgi:hypothetical protein